MLTLVKDEERCWFASARPAPSRGPLGGHGEWSAGGTRPPNCRGLALRTNTLAWPWAGERIAAHEAATGLFLIGAKRFGF